MTDSRRASRAAGVTLRGAVVAAVLAWPLVSAAPALGASCGGAEYSYAGWVGAGPSAGVHGTVTSRAPATVRAGHVAGWIGLGGSSPSGRSWLQAGLNARAGGVAEVYYELALPGKRPRLTSIRPARAGESTELAVVELAGRPGWWQVWIDGTKAGPSLFVPGSHGQWRPMALGESWNGGAGACNAYTYSFSNLALGAEGTVTPWHVAEGRRAIEDKGFRLVAESKNSFVAAAEAA